MVRIRSDLIAYIWKRPTLPRDLPDVETDVPNPFADVLEMSAVHRIDRLTVRLDDFVSQMYLFVPAHPRRALTIFHAGHSHTFQEDEGAGTVRFFLKHRYPVLVVFMPLYGPNTGPVSSAFYHDVMPALETATRSPIRYFLEPVVQAVNYARWLLRSSHVSMIGLSGGGWTTTLAAAVDLRIRTSVAVAGSLPLYLRRPPCLTRPERGDFEQRHEPLFALADYLDLYVLASYGFARRHLQVLNQFDACCFSGIRFLTYRDIVEGVVRDLGRGRCDLFLDSSHALHQISPLALDAAIYPFVRAAVTEGMALH